MKKAIFHAVLMVFLWAAAGPILAAKKGPKDPAERKAETEAMNVAFEEALFKEYVQRLKDKDPVTRRSGAEKLAELRNPAAVEPLLKVLNDPVAAVRTAAVDTLGILRAQAAAKPIANLLKTDPWPTVRQTAAIALGYIGDPETVPALIDGLKDANDGTRFACVNSLGILRDATAVKALTEQLKNPDPRMRRSVAYSLGNIKDKAAVPALVETLKISRSTAPAKGQEAYVDAAIGASIIRSLGLIGDPQLTGVIKPYLDDKDPTVRIAAAHALYKMGSRSGIGVARKYLSDKDAGARKMAVEVLGDMGGPEDVQAIQRMKSDPDPQVKQAVAQTLQKLSKTGKPAAATSTPKQTKAASPDKKKTQ